MKAVLSIFSLAQPPLEAGSHSIASVDNARLKKEKIVICKAMLQKCNLGSYVGLRLSLGMMTVMTILHADEQPQIFF